MTALTTEEFITWANRLASLPWPMTAGEFAKIATGEFGWAIFDGDQVLTAIFSNCSEYVLVGRRSTGEVRRILFAAVKAEKDGSRSELARLNDHFVNYANAGSVEWGEAFKTVIGKRPLKAWRTINDGVCELVRGPHEVTVTLYTPQGARYYE